MFKKVYIIFLVIILGGLTFFSSVTLLAADKEEKARNMGLYSKPVFVRYGIDDLGTNFKGVLNCFQKIADETFDDGRRVTWSFTFFGDVEIKYPGTGKDLKFTLEHTEDSFLLVTQYYVGFERITDQDDIYSYFVAIGRICSDLDKPETGFNTKPQGENDPSTSLNSDNDEESTNNSQNGPRIQNETEETSKKVLSFEEAFEECKTWSQKILDKSLRSNKKMTSAQRQTNLNRGLSICMATKGYKY